MAHEPRPYLGHYSGKGFGLIDAPSIERRQYRERMDGAIIALLVIAMLALAILPDRPTPDTCHPNGTLTKATL